ncbi:MAG: hypothetical protein LBG76_05425 [Treponema sp.]|jgi:uncharacterized membrane protein YgaE (UPF0421/DUF939 family)|nr:hypothetical protein [Treponema sp.]
MDTETQEAIEEVVEVIAGSELAYMVVGVAASIVMNLVVTDMEKRSLTGKKEFHPTQDETTMSKVEATAKDTDASLGKDEVTAKDGDLSANRTDAAASTGEATALDGGATAVRTKAGAADIETKSLKMT